MKEIIEKILEEIKRQDTEKLIWKERKTKVSIDESKRGNIYLHIKLESKRSHNKLAFSVYQKSEDDIYFREYIGSYNEPRHGPFDWVRYDQIDPFIRYEVENSITIEKIPEIIEKVLLVGYSVWGNKWGYITKAGRKAKTKLHQMGYKFEKRREMEKYFHYYYLNKPLKF